MVFGVFASRQIQNESAGDSISAHHHASTLSEGRNLPKYLVEAVRKAAFLGSVYLYLDVQMFPWDGDVFQARERVCLDVLFNESVRKCTELLIQYMLTGEIYSSTHSKHRKSH